MVNVNYWYSLPGVYGVFKIGEMSAASITFQYMMLDKKMKISLKGNDIFRTDALKGNSVVNGVYQSFKYYYDTQSIQLSINYRFGSNKIKTETRETGNQDERGRTHN